MSRTHTEGLTNTDRIEKQVILRARRSRVWRAITNAISNIERHVSQP